MFCIACGADNPAQGKFCYACGKPLITAPVESQPAATVVAPPAPDPPAVPNPRPAPAAEPTPTPTPTPVPAPVIPAPQPPPAAAPVQPPAAPALGAHPQFAPPSLDQAFALVESEKRYKWVSIPIGVVGFGIAFYAFFNTPAVANFAFILAVVAGGVVYFGAHFFLLPVIMPPTVVCPHCRKQVAMSRDALPKGVWPWACPHCHQELVPKGLALKNTEPK